jgi:very-short-patch-repair endonuclease
MPHHLVQEQSRVFARSMRREPSEAERLLWGALRGRRLDRIKFRRQVPVDTYIADFICAEAMLIIEIDGSQHAQSDYDRQRTIALNKSGFRVLRFWNDEVLRELNEVCDTIIAYVRDPRLQPWR